MAEVQKLKTEEGNASSTVVIQNEEAEISPLPSVRMKLKKPKKKKRVAWTADTVDNENMDKKKSKCCCIYEKPKEFGESSSESEDECEHCKGHVEQKRHTTKTVSPQDDSHIHANGPETK